MKTLSEGQRFDLCVLNPLLVFGPLLSNAYSSSVEIVARVAQSESCSQL